MIVAMPHCGMNANSTSGGEVVEREVISRLPAVGIEPHVIAAPWRGLRWWNSLFYFAPALRRCVREHRPALIRAHSLRYTGIPAIIAARLSGIPVTVHFHHLEQDRLSWLDRWVLRHADRVTTDSLFSQHQARQLGVTAQVIRLGVDHQRFPPRPMPAGRLVLLVGGNKPRKNVEFVQALWPQVLRRVSDTEFLEVGQGVAVDDEAMATCYHRARLVAFPSVLEGFGLPVLEAMASARPLVCSDRTALPEFGAVSTLALRPSLWVDWIVEYLTNDRRWREAAESNAAKAWGYSWERTAREMATAWRQCVSA